MNFLTHLGLFQQFITCDNRTKSPALFQNIFKFCTFLPKFSITLTFCNISLPFFLKNCTHAFNFQNRPCLYVCFMLQIHLPGKKNHILIMLMLFNSENCTKLFFLGSSCKMNPHVLISQMFVLSLYLTRKSKANYQSALLLQYYVKARQILLLVKRVYSHFVYRPRHT